MPTPAARATSRILRLLGTPSIRIVPLAVSTSCLRFLADNVPPTVYPRASLAHPITTEVNNGPDATRAFGKKQKKESYKASFQDSDLTYSFPSIRVGNQFQCSLSSTWSFFEASGVCDEETVCSLFRLGTYLS